MRRPRGRGKTRSPPHLHKPTSLHALKQNKIARRTEASTSSKPQLRLEARHPRMNSDKSILLAGTHARFVIAGGTEIEQATTSEPHVTKIGGTLRQIIAEKESTVTGAETAIKTGIGRVGLTQTGHADITRQSGHQTGTSVGHDHAPELRKITEEVDRANDLDLMTEIVIIETSQTRELVEVKTQQTQITTEDLLGSSRHLQRQARLRSWFRARKLSVRISKCARFG